MRTTKPGGKGNQRAREAGVACMEINKYKRAGKDKSCGAVIRILNFIPKA